MGRYEFIEHTADAGVRISAASREDLFRTAASALFSLLTDYRPGINSTKTLTLKAQNSEELLVGWLNELLSLFYVENFLPAEYTLSLKDQNGTPVLDTVFKGERVEGDKAALKCEVKAATYHNLKLAKTDDGYVAEVIFDV